MTGLQGMIGSYLERVGGGGGTGWERPKRRHINKLFGLFFCFF